MKIQITLGKDFEDMYNKFNNSETGKQLLKIEGISRTELDLGEMGRKYFTEKLSDFSVNQNANSNEQISPVNYSSEIVKAPMKLDGLYLMWHYANKRFGAKRANELIEAVISGDVHLHDSSGAGIQMPYCISYSTTILMNEGRKYGQLHSLPPKRARSFIANAIEVNMELSQCFAGAVACADLIVNYAWYAQKEGLTDYEIVNDFQSFVFVMNNQFRIGGESPFSNLSLFDMPNLKKLFDSHMYPDGSKPDFDYIMKLQKLFGDFFKKGDVITGLPYRFPVVTINIYCDDNKNIPDQDFLEWTSQANLDSGCFNIYINSGEKIASCCRLINDKRRMKCRVDSFGNGGSGVGSDRVVTANLPRIALKSEKDHEKFKTELYRILDICRDLLIVHREDVIRRRIESGFLKFFKPLGWFNLDRLFSTIGIIGVYEMNYFMGYDIRESTGQLFTSDILKTIEEYAIEMSNITGKSVNVEEIPGESVAVKFCQKDKIVFGNDKIPFELYSNQYVPLISDCSIPERIKISGMFMETLSGGGICHLNIAEKINDPGVMKKLIEYAVSQGVTHLAVNYGFGICENGHTTISGTSEICPVCKGKIVDWVTRIVGYFVHTNSWNTIRRDWEFPRREFGEVKALS